MKCVNNETKKISVAVSFMTSEKKDKDRESKYREKWQVYFMLYFRWGNRFLDWVMAKVWQLLSLTPWFVVAVENSPKVDSLGTEKRGWSQIVRCII